MGVRMCDNYAGFTLNVKEFAKQLNLNTVFPDILLFITIDTYFYVNLYQ